ncbi:MAG: hypothetical protein H0Z28_10290 [Archaeoglobus sp.]|nr:hypothetical protein [Archaeoglobus sp.]
MEIRIPPLLSIIFLIPYLIVPALALSEENIPSVDPGITPDSSFYFLDTLFDNLRLKFWELMQALRLADDDKVAKEMLNIIAERKAELRYLDAKGRLQSKLGEKLQQTIERWIHEYEDYTRPKLNVSYIVEGYDITVKLKNVWDREITYVTGGIKGESDDGKKIDYQSPIPYPLNLKPGEVKVFEARIPSEYAGNWTVLVHIKTWDGKRLVKQEFRVSIPG